MEILMNSMPDINPSSLQTQGAGLNRQDKSSQDKTEFASFIHKEYSKSADRNSDKKDIYSKGAIKEEAGAGEGSSACSNCSPDLNNTMYNAGGKSARQETDEIEAVSGDDGQKEDEVDPEHGLKNGALLFALLHGYMTEKGNALAVLTGEGTSEKADTAAGGPGSGHIPENGLKVGILLNDMISDVTAEPVLQGAELPGSPGDNGLKVGALLYKLATNYAAETGGVLNPAPEGEQDTGIDAVGSSGSSEGNGLKVGTILNSLVTGFEADIDEGTEPVNEASEPHSESGLKMGALLNRLAGRSDEAEINKGPVKEEMVSAEKPIEIKAEIDGFQADSLVFGEEVSGEAETKSRTSGHIEKVYSEDRVKNEDILKTNDKVDIPETNENAEGLNSRLSTGLSEQFKQDNGTEDRTFNLPKGTHNSGSDAETNNINSINTSHMTSENARSVQGLSALHTPKTPGAQELLDNLVYIIKGNSKMGVSVEHESLGKLNISLSLEKGLVNVHINTSDRVVRELLENNIQQIIDTLNKEGVNVGEFSLALRDHKEQEINRFSLKSGQGREIPIDTKKGNRHSGLVNIFA